MSVSNRYESILLLLGDVLLLTVSLWVTLLLRYQDVPSRGLLLDHLAPFSILIVVWVLVFFIAGLYDRHTTLFKKRLPFTILQAQIFNIVLAAIFFFLIPQFGIAPKTNLLIYLMVSSIAVIVWRMYVFPRFGRNFREGALLIGSGSEAKELYEEINGNNRYALEFVGFVDLAGLSGDHVSDRIFSALRDRRVATVVVDTNHERLRHILPHLYKPIFSETRFVDMSEVYEEIFERVPLSSSDYEQFLRREEEHLASRILKRAFDLFGGAVLGLAIVALFPFIALMIKSEDGGPVLILQKRIGLGGKPISVWKFRTMERNDDTSRAWVSENGSKNPVTKVGKFLRKTSIDEFPQCINVLKGEMSLIGPRSDIVGLWERLKDEIPYYHLRASALPGITGWAQIKQQYAIGNISPQSVPETRLRFAYDLYYLKHQSFMLDVSIAFRTVGAMLSRVV